MTKQREYERTHPWITFRLDLSKAIPSFWATLGECQSKCEHIAGVPLRPDVSRILHSVYLAKGVWGTTAIEGNTLSEEEVLRLLQGKLDLPPEKEYLRQEVDNILEESNNMLERVQRNEPLLLSTDRIRELNRVVLNKLDTEGVVPGEIRKYSVGVMNYRGAPWQDCEFLFDRLCTWVNGPDFSPPTGFNEIHMAIIKAIITHLYIEWIHGFGDGNGRTGRLVEVQILLAAGVPAPACQLLSNHYNQTRKEYLRQLRHASESKGDVMPFLTYALNGLLAGLRGQLVYIQRLNMETSWVNFVHGHFRHQNSSAAQRQKSLLLDISEKGEPVSISDIDKLTPRLAKAYHGMHPRTLSRDVDSLTNAKLLIRDGKKLRANLELMTTFLPVRAKNQVSSAGGRDSR